MWNRSRALRTFCIVFGATAFAHDPARLGLGLGLGLGYGGQGCLCLVGSLVTNAKVAYGRSRMSYLEYRL